MTKTKEVTETQAAAALAALEQELAEWPHAFVIAKANAPEKLPYLDTRRALLPDLICAAKQQFYDARLATLQEERVALQAHADETRATAAKQNLAVNEAEQAWRAAQKAEQRCSVDATIAAAQLSQKDTEIAQLRRERAKLESGNE